MNPGVPSGHELLTIPQIVEPDNIRDFVKITAVNT